jgi:hypothetical protein
MASIDITISSGTIHIELLDNPFVKKWTEHFLKMQKVYDMDYRAFAHPVYNSNKTSQEILKDLENLRNTIIKLNDMGANFPVNPWKVVYEKIFPDHDAGQQILNEIHRYFTTGGRTLNEYEDTNIFNSGHWSDDFDSKFTFDKENEEEFRHTHALVNDYVHELDQSILTSRKDIDFKNQAVNLQFEFGSQKKDCRFDSGTWVSITEEDYMYADDKVDIDVWCGNDILGKDYIEAYYDHDDPTQWDVWPIMGHSGKFKINVASTWYEEDITGNTILQQLVKSDNFQNWLKEHNIEYVPEMCGMPLGKITDGKELVTRNNFQQPPISFNVIVNN